MDTIFEKNSPQEQKKERIIRLSDERGGRKDKDTSENSKPILALFGLKTSMLFQIQTLSGKEVPGWRCRQMQGRGKCKAFCNNELQIQLSKGFHA